MIFPSRKAVVERQPVEQVEQLLKQHLYQQTQALIALARSQTIERGDWKAALREMTEVAANILEVERVSIWLYQENTASQVIPFWLCAGVNSTLVEQASDTEYQPQSTASIRMKCVDLYEHSRGCHTSGLELAADNYPTFFQTLAIADTLAVQDVHADPRSQELSEPYFTPNGISSILNAPIWLNGQMVGIVCHEHTGLPRQWTLIEENFAAAIATLVTLTLEACDRVLAQQQMSQHQQFLVSEYPDDLERSKDDTMLPAEVRSQAIPEQGRPLRVTAIRDITAQIQAQEELKQSVSLLHATLNSTSDGVVGISMDGKVVSFNQKFIEIWGISPEILLSSTAQERLSFFQTQLKEPEAFRETVMHMYAQPDAEGYDVLELKDGRIFERFTQPQRIGTKIIGRVWCFRDITERAKAEQALRQHLQQELLIARICDRIRQSLNLREILKTTVEEVRQFLRTDRVLIYRFEPDWSGTVVVESVASEYLATLDRVIHDPCFGVSQVQPYRGGRIQAVNDIYTAGLTPCYIQFLSQLQVRANLVVPILQGGGSQARGGEEERGREREILYSHLKANYHTSPTPCLTSSPTLWGLLIAHHCSDSRQWQSLEIDLLKSLATQVAIAIQQSSLFEQLEAANQELQRLACVDGLTQVANRRRFDEYLESEWQRLLREQKPLSLILCDLDYFKRYNDTYGHLAGDLCLQQVAGVLRQALRRPADLVARYGGEEFAMILPNSNDRAAAFVAEVVRENVRRLKIPHAGSPVSHYVTLSLGVASKIPTRGTSPQALIAAADEALYRAKEEGRDHVIVIS